MNNNNKLSPPEMRSYALRKGRYSCRDGIYLLTSVTYNRQPLFSDRRLGRHVAAAFRRMEEAGQARSLAWVVMPDHFHWLAEMGEASLSSLMHNVKGSSAAVFGNLVTTIMQYETRRI